jgi:hypothetical protein
MVPRQINLNVSVLDCGLHQLGIKVNTTAATLTAPEAVLLMTEIAAWLNETGWRRQVDGGWVRLRGKMVEDGPSA